MSAWVLHAQAHAHLEAMQPEGEVRRHKAGAAASQEAQPSPTLKRQPAETLKEEPRKRQRAETPKEAAARHDRQHGKAASKTRTSDKALLSENDRLRMERACADKDLRAARAELALLQRRNAELERVAVAGGASAGSGRTPDLVGATTPPVVRRLEPRGYGQRSWDYGRFRDAGLVEASAQAPVLAEAPRAEVVASAADAVASGAIVSVPVSPTLPPGEAVDAVVNLPAPGPGSLAPLPSSTSSSSTAASWIAQHTLLEAPNWGPLFLGEQGLGDVFRGAMRELKQCGPGEGTTSLEALSQAFSAHLQGSNQPHLLFSAALPPLFASLREGSAAMEHSASPTEHAVSERAYAHCVAIIQHLMRTARFGDDPPLACPADMTRERFVRELCGHLGLCLDLARLYYAQRREFAKDNKDRGRAQAQTAASLQERGSAVSTPRSSPVRPRSPSPALHSGEISEVVLGATGAIAEGSAIAPEVGSATSSRRGRHCAVGQQVVKAAMRRAGHYLRAVQMDMDRLHEDAEKRLKTPSAPKTEVAREDPLAPLPLQDGETGGVPVATSGPATVQQEAPMTSPGVDGLTWEEERALPADEMPVSNVEKTRKLTAAASDTSVIVTVERPLAAVEGEVDTLVAPSFGHFLERQLLPLYVGDIPFSELRRLAQNYGGTPLDSDDEDKAWKNLGRQHVPEVASGRSSRAAVSREAESGRERRLRRSVSTVGVDAARALTNGSRVPAASMASAPSSETREATSAKALRRLSSKAAQVAAGGSPEDIPLGRLAEAAFSRTPALRAQVPYSVVERRHHDLRAPPPRIIPQKAKTSKVSPAGATSGATSAALVAGIASASSSLFSARSSSDLERPRSPLTVRRPSSGLKSPISTRKPVQTPARGRTPQVAGTPSWDVLDTPMRHGDSGDTPRR